LSIEDYVESIIEKDLIQFKKDLKLPKMDMDYKKNVYPVIADFTEYSPLHNGHLYCMNKAKQAHPDALFVAVIPGLFERNGRGLPYIMHRNTRAKLAISLGADIAVEGPPMGVMGSGQYSLCLALMFKTLNADYIPRGYISNDPQFMTILNYIRDGRPVAPRPYKIVSLDDKKVLLEGKLSNDDYVIVSLAKSLSKIGFDYKDKFIFIPRLENVSGTKIRQCVSSSNFDNLDQMLPEKTIDILKNEIESNHAPLHELRANKRLLNNVNNLSMDELSNLTLIDSDTVKNIIEGRPFDNLDDLTEAITYGFSSHRKQRILSVLEATIISTEMNKYINNYPQLIRILGYKSKEALNKFKFNLENNSIGEIRITCQ